MYHVDELCERYQMICVDDDGNKHAEPLLTLAKQRVNGKIVFNVNDFGFQTILRVLPIQVCCFVLEVAISSVLLHSFLIKKL